MKRLIFLLSLSLIFGLSFFGYYRTVYPKMPREIESLNRRIEAKNEKLISAQILASDLNLVARLIDQNLAISAKDSLAQDASLPFLDFMTGLLEEHDIKLVTLEPDRRRVTRHDYVRTSYELVIDCNFKGFGKFVNSLEKSERLVTVESFEVKNTIAEAASKDKEKYDTHFFELKVTTLTLIKHS